MLHFYFLVWCLLLFNVCYCDDTETSGDISRKIPQGKLIGEWRKSFKDRPYGAFEGIPYARSPVGKRRFLPPQPPKHWHGVWQAKKLPSMCIQFYEVPHNEDASVIGNEDCLYLNVYSPSPKSSAKLPVIVYIHGGAFIFGTGIEYGPRYLMDRDVVYVSINYRLGILGFMSTQDEELPGNIGLKDQAMALRWIRENIKHFGGDPGRVTITGMSAGGASVHYHTLSDMSKGLFHRAISQSGTALCPWTLQEGAAQKAARVAAALGCPAAPSRDMLACLKHRPASAIVRTTAMFEPYLHSPFSPFAPVVEPANVKNPFISEHPYELVRKGKAHDVPWITSLTAHEGLYPAAIFIKKDEYLNHLEEKWTDLAAHVFDYNFTLPSSEYDEAAHKIKEFYTQGKPITMKTLQQLIKAIGDRHFFIDVQKCTKLQGSVGKQPIYNYFFNYAGEGSLGKFLSHSTKSLGVSHGDDTGYVIDCVFMDPTTTQQDRDMIELMIDMFSSFATNGVPQLQSVNWTPVNIQGDEYDYLEIGGPQNLKMKTTSDITNGGEAFWKSLNLKENEQLFASKRDEL